MFSLRALGAWRPWSKGYHEIAESESRPPTKTPTEKPQAPHAMGTEKKMALILVLLIVVLAGAALFAKALQFTHDFSTFVLPTGRAS